MEQHPFAVLNGKRVLGQEAPGLGSFIKAHEARLQRKASNRLHAWGTQAETLELTIEDVSNGADVDQGTIGRLESLERHFISLEPKPVTKFLASDLLYKLFLG